MNNECHSKVIRKGNVDNIFNSRETITLTNVYVPEINRNLISEDLLKNRALKAFVNPKKLYYLEMRNLLKNAVLMNE